MKDLKGKIVPGTVLLSEKPFVYCLSSKVITEYCDYCFKKWVVIPITLNKIKNYYPHYFRGMLLKCTACQYVRYCGKYCQKEGWSVHKSECKGLKKIAPRILPDAARMLLRMVQKLKKNGNQVRSYYADMKFRMYKDLMSRK